MSKEIVIKTEKTTNYIYLQDKGSPIPILFLHGFTGSHHSWDEVLEKIKVSTISVDLPGHGKSIFNNLDKDYSINDWCEDFNKILDSLKISKIDLCGYSMGGRLAIIFASKYPRKINKLILESSSYGIESKHEKAKRLKKDLNLCNLIEKDLQQFVQKWENNTLFLKQKDRNAEGFLKQRKERLSHNPKQLSKALSSFSQSKMDVCIDHFYKFKFPVLIINGSEDSKHVKIGVEILSVSREAAHHVVYRAGHNVHIEKCSDFIRLIIFEK